MVVTRQVGSDARSFTHDSHTAGVGGGISSMPIGQFGVGLEQTLNHDEVPGNIVSVQASESSQLSASRSLQFACLNVGGNVRLCHPLTLRGTRVAASEIIMGPATLLATSITATLTAV